MDITKVKTISDKLSTYDYLKNNDADDNFIEIHRWQNDEGFIAMVGDKTIELTDGELDAIVHLNNCLRYDTTK